MYQREMVTTTFTIEGYRIKKQLGVVRGITVRSNSVIGSIGASIQQFFGGHISIYTEMCENARKDAFDLMVKHAQEIGANAIVGMRYDANELSPGVTEVLAYGTAVIIEPVSR
jgi:uncharacterized protein YbjQ (UPF0145 family)